MNLRSNSRAALVVFLAAGVVLFWLCADLMTLNVDEGIYLDGALRVFNGQAPYRDLFTHTGPGTYWLYGAVFGLTQPSLVWARVPLIIEIAAAMAVVFFLTAGLTTRLFGCIVVCVFFAFTTRDLRVIALNHRWDSSLLAFIALGPAYAALRSGSRSLSFISGALAAAAAWCTPPLALAGAVVALWMLVMRRQRKLLLPFIAGVAALSLICVGVLIAERALVPMVEHLLWTGSNYTGANRVPYGWAGTGYFDLGSGLGVIGWMFYSLLLIVVMLPAALPPIVLLAWAAYFAIRRNAGQFPETVFLIAASVPLLISTYPRWDSWHLLYVSPIFYVLAAAFLYLTLPLKLRPILFTGVAFTAIFVWAPVLAQAGRYGRLATPAGTLRVSDEDRELLTMAVNDIHPGDSLFVFPYLPTIYFLTRGVNPTRFSYLQPGLMTKEDETIALQELQSRPPEWVLYDYVPPEVYLQHWPSSDPRLLRLNLIEDFFAANYKAVEKHKNRLGEFSLLRRIPKS